MNLILVFKMKKIIFLLGVLVFSSVSKAGLIIPAHDTGWYWNAFHQPGNINYVAGLSDNRPVRNFFVFDLADVGQVSKASLRIFQTGPTSLLPGGGFFSNDPFETFVLSEVSLGAESIISRAFGRGYTDLGDGPQYGSINISESDEDGFVEIALNATALEAISSNNSLWAIGGSISTLENGGIDQYVFAGSGNPMDPYVELVVTKVPDPNVLLLLMTGLLSLTISKRKVFLEN